MASGSWLEQRVRSARASPSLVADVAVVVAAAAVVGVAVFVLQFQGLGLPDAMKYGQLGRNLARGEGYTTDMIRPLAYTFDPSLAAHHTFVSPPAFPTLVALAYLLVGVSGGAVAGVATLASVVTTPLVYLLARDLYDRPTGLVAATLFATSFVVLKFALLGYPTTTFLVVFTLLLWALHRGARPAIVGALLGLGYLTRFNTLLFVPGVLWYVAVTTDAPLGDRRTLRRVAAVLGAAAVVVAPWGLRNVLLVGDPLFSLHKYEIAMFTSVYPGYLLYHQFEPVSPVAFALAHPAALAGKVATGAVTLYTEVPDLFRFPTAGLAVAGLFVPATRRRRTFLAAVGLMAAIQFVGITPIHAIPRLFIAFTPVVAILAATAIIQVGRWIELPRARTAAVVGLLALVVLPNLLTAFVIYDPPGVPPAESLGAGDGLDAVHARTDPGDAVVTDVPWAVAWQADRPAVWLPTSYRALEQRVGPVEYVYISDPAGPGPPGVSIDPGPPYIDNPAFRQDYRLVERFDSGALLFQRRTNATPAD